MRINIFLIAIIAIVAISCNEVKKETSANAIFKSEKDTIDFGKLTSYDTAEHKINISNTGTEALYISNVMASCGCRVPKLTDTLIEEGKSTTIRIKYKPHKGDSGKFSKSVVLKTNCEEPFKLIRVIGTFEPNSHE